ncbi:MAG: hypothetical protein M3348_01695 [Acidobacteriota bacterium]|nr:hypothetical protein [Acidobacteriota bacterium]
MKIVEIGEPKREILVEPLELPEPLRPEEKPERVERPKPEKEPVGAWRTN